MAHKRHKPLLLCLVWLLLAGPVANAFAAAAMPGHADHVMQQPAAGDIACDGCATHGGSPKAPSCCDGADCALMGGCAACAAIFYRFSMAASPAFLTNIQPALDQQFLSHHPELPLRPPRA